MRPCSCHTTAQEHTFSLYSRSCKFQSTKAPSAAKSSNRTPGETLQRNTPFASIVEVASSRVLKHLPPPNLLIELEVRPLPTCTDTEEYTFRLYSRSCKLQSTRAPSPQNLPIELQVSPRPGLRRNTPFASIVEVASSRVQKHLLPPNLVIELQVRPRTSCGATEEIPSASIVEFVS